MDTGTKVYAAIMTIVLIIVLVSSCSEQGKARSYGGEMNVTLEPNQKLVEVTWKGSQLWFLTKEMSGDDTAESYNFYEKSTLGIIEGSVKIKEVKLTDEELAEYKAQATYEEDYNNQSNFNVYGDPLFIEYDEETGRYILLKPYTYSPAGSLVAE